MKKSLFTSAIALLILAGCDDYNEKYFGDLDDKTAPSDIKAKEYTLADEDYATIASNKVNKAIAEEEGTSTELGQLKDNKYFSGMISAEKYVPAFIDNMYPYADNTSVVKLTYNKAEEVSEYITRLNAARKYTVSDENYKEVWQDVEATYFTPAKSPSSKLPGILKANMENPVDGEYVVVTYKYSDVEPNTGGDEPEDQYPTIASVIAGEVGEYTVKGTVAGVYGQGLLLSDESASILVYTGTATDSKVGDIVTVQGTTSTYGGLTQFGNKPAAPIITKIKTDDEYVAPIPQQLDGDEMLALAAAPVVVPVAYVGTLNISTSSDGAKTYYNVALDGRTDVRGSISALLPDEATNIAALDGKKVAVNGYFVGKSVSGTTTNITTLLTSIQPLDDYTDITDITAAGIEAKVRATVIAIYSKGFLMNDGSASILTYLNAPHEYVVGDVVEVSGTSASYGGLLQFPNTSTIKLVANKANFITPTPEVLDGAGMDAIYANPEFKYISYTGTLTISTSEKGTYYNVAVDGTTTAVGSIQYPVTGLVDAALNGKVVTVTGYMVGTSGGKYVNTMATSVVEGTAKMNKSVRNTFTNFASVASALKATRAATAVETRYAVYQYSEADTKWAEATGVLIVNPSDYLEMGATHLNLGASMNPDNYLPKFMERKKPYGQEGDVMAVVYDYYDGAATYLQADEYLHTGNAWVKNNFVETVTDQFVKANGKWSYNPSLVLTLPVGKGQATSAAFYQPISDYVWEKIDQPAGATIKGQGYATSFGNNEYYYGSSAYQNNFDFRIAAWRAQNKKAYESLSDEDLTALMYQRIPEALNVGLEASYPTLKPIDGIDVTVTIKFSVYDGTKTYTYQIIYNVVGEGKFEYVPESLQKI